LPADPDNSAAATAKALARKKELGAFLRRMRGKVQPMDVGLEPRINVRRQTPGLRRQEVAELAGVGLTWYTWLEQGRDIPASAQVIAALSRVLRLDADERHYLHALAGLDVGDSEVITSISAAAGRLLTSLLPNPAFIRNSRYDILAWNSAVQILWPELSRVSVPQRNFIWLLFADAGLRNRMVYWEDRAKAATAEFRSVAGKHAGDDRYQQLVDNLTNASPEFARWWDEYAVSTFRLGTETIDHPAVGRVQLELWQLPLDGEPGATLFLCTPMSERDRRALTQLAAESS
jgi:transcriptional regulator with XRE-family HTH domain